MDGAGPLVWEEDLGQGEVLWGLSWTWTAVFMFCGSVFGEWLVLGVGVLVFSGADLYVS